LSLVAVALIWGAGFIVVKNSLDFITPLWLLAARFTVAAIAITFIFFSKIRKVNRGSLLAGIGCGVFVYFAFAFQTIGVQNTTASKNALLTSSYVVLVPFIFWIMIRTRPKVSQIIAAFMCFTGIAMLMFNGSFGKINIGDVYTLICGVLFAFQISLLGIYSKKFDPVVLTIVQMVTCAVISVIIAVIFEDVPRNLGGNSLASILYLGLLSTCFAYLVQTVAQKYTAPSHASLIMSLECVIGCILSVMIFKDVFTPLMWAGSVLTFASVVLSQQSSRNGLSRAIKIE
jgi:drug/metabolite transporter (DMT)-like permease